MWSLLLSLWIQSLHAAAAGVEIADAVVCFGNLRCVPTDFHSIPSLLFPVVDLAAAAVVVAVDKEST